MDLSSVSASEILLTIIVFTIFKDKIVASTLVPTALSVFVFQDIIWPFVFLLSPLVTVSGYEIKCATLEAPICKEKEMHHVFFTLKYVCGRD
jgi:hypothetical protein